MVMQTQDLQLTQKIAQKCRHENYSSCVTISSVNNLQVILFKVKA